MLDQDTTDSDELILKAEYVNLTSDEDVVHPTAGRTELST